MDIFPNNRQIVSFEARRATFADLIAKLETAENNCRAGYKAETLETLNLAIGMVNSLANEFGVDALRETRSKLFIAANKTRAR